MTDYSQYLSPFSWRYGSPEMRSLWSEESKRRLWRKIWVALAQTQAEFGVISSEQAADLSQHADQIDLPRALEIEAEIHHDLMAELKVFAEQSPVGGGILHLGATSMDIEDNAEALRLRLGLETVGDRLAQALWLLAERLDAWVDLPVMAYTHLQPAEPTTLGYRFAIYAQDLLGDWQRLEALRLGIRGKGFKGAVGTGAAICALIGTEHFVAFETRLSEQLGLEFYPTTTQTSPRKQEYDILSGLAGIGASLHKFAFDLRLLQSPSIGEVSEPFGEAQVGSSAMPFKRNPIQAEKIDSLARLLAQMPQVAWQNAANSLLERTLDDSANRRTLLPEAFLICDELLLTAHKVLQGLQVDREAIRRNFERYAPFAAMEWVMAAGVKNGADRQEMHARLRRLSLLAWEEIRQGRPNLLQGAVREDADICRYLSAEELERCFELERYLGIAPQRAHEMAVRIRSSVLRK